ncbi:MAG: carboxy terminal-processing peptidase [Opitutae bacterium]|nr:carboxy terminal-processing peptidase [Opitutae bacterium]
MSHFPSNTLNIVKRFAALALLPLLSLNGQTEDRKVIKLEPTPKMVGETKWVAQALQRYHYLNQSVSDVDFKEFISFFMKKLDGYHMYFLDSDREQFELRFGLNMPTYLQDGNLYPAYKIFEKYQKRAYARIDWVFDRLDKPFDFTSEGTYMPDRAKVDWPKDEAAANDVWEARLAYEILNEILSEEAAEKKRLKEEEGKEKPKPVATKSGQPAKEVLEDAVKTIRRRFERWEKTLGEYEAWNVQEIFLTSLTSMFDPHSTFMSVDSLEDFNMQINNSFVGIGAVLQDEDGYCTIQKLLPGGPAQGSEELAPDDKIVGVAQGEDEFVDVIDMNLRKIVKLIKGPKNTKVRLEIIPAGADPGDRKIVSLIRDQIKLTANLARAEIIQVPHEEKTIPIGLLDLPSFYGGGRGQNSSTTSDIEELIGKLKEAGVKGIILDLRHNGGGLLSEAVKLSGLFIPTGPVVQVKDTTGRIKKHLDRNPKTAWDGPLMVLVSRYSASASEIVAGALQDHNRAIIVGDSSTHGKGTVQAIFQVDEPFIFNFRDPKRSAAKVTIQKFYLPSGRSTQNKGVPSDIVIQSANEFLPIGESDLPRALKWDEIPKLDLGTSQNNPEKSAKLDKALFDALRTTCEKRQGTIPEFKYLKKSIEWYRQRRDQKSFSLNLAGRRNKAVKDKEKQDLLNDSLKKLAKDKFSAEEILLHIAIKQGEKPKDLNEVDEDDPKYDIHRREGLRIMAEWIDLRGGATTSSVSQKVEEKKEI